MTSLVANRELQTRDCSEAIEDSNPDLFCVKEGPRKALTCVFADEALDEVSQESRLVPLGSVGSLTRR
jgi:hypothetical protein